MVGLGQKGVARGWDCLKYLERGWNRKEGKGGGGKLGPRGGCLKKKRGWNPLTNHVPLIIKTDKNFKIEKILKFNQFCNF